MRRGEYFIIGILLLVTFATMAFVILAMDTEVPILWENL